MVLLANAGNSISVIERFLGRARTDIPSIMDETESIYRTYDVPPNYAPYPRQIIIDQNGVIRYLAAQYDAPEVLRRIEELLED